MSKMKRPTKQKLMPPAVAKTVPKFCSTEETRTEDKVLHVKLFATGGRGTWYIAEYDPTERTAFGWVVSPLGPDCDEWGYFSIDELESLCVRPQGGPLPVWVERDEHWKPITFGELQRCQGARETPRPLDTPVSPTRDELVRQAAIALLAADTASVAFEAAGRHEQVLALRGARRIIHALLEELSGEEG